MFELVLQSDMVPFSRLVPVLGLHVGLGECKILSVVGEFLGVLALS